MGLEGTGQDAGPRGVAALAEEGLWGLAWIAQDGESMGVGNGTTQDCSGTVWSQQLCLLAWPQTSTIHERRRVSIVMGRARKPQTPHPSLSLNPDTLGLKSQNL